MAEPSVKQLIKSLDNCMLDPNGECCKCSFDRTPYPECERNMIKYAIEILKGGDSNDQASVSPK